MNPKHREMIHRQIDRSNLDRTKTMTGCSLSIALRAGMDELLVTIHYW